MGIVGESGCGKSTSGRVILRLLEPTSGEAIFDGKNIFSISAEELRKLRREMQIIFQDPFASLNPRMSVSDLIGEPLKIHGVADGHEKVKRVKELLEIVGLNAYHLQKEAFLSAIPVPDPEVNRERIILAGDVPSPVHIPAGCRFHTRRNRFITNNKLGMQS